MTTETLDVAEALQVEHILVSIPLRKARWRKDSF